MGTPNPQLSGLPVINRNVLAGSLQPDVFNSGAVILIDKPLDWTSFDAVKYIRNRVPAKKVGHAGTLDPLATGLLVLCTGKATKAISQIQDLPKTYQAVVRLGASTPSFDAATEPDNLSDWSHVQPEEIDRVLTGQFTGQIEQVPPVYSAKRVGGKRLYHYARKGEEVEIEPRTVLIHQISIDDISLPEITMTIHCGKGTYIRSLANDLGLALGTHGYLSGLRRTETGHFHVEDAFTPHEFDANIKPEQHG